MEPRDERGRPRPATPERAKLTIDEIARLSGPFGTTVIYRDDRGVVNGPAKGH